MNKKANKAQEELAEKLHIWYLEAVRKLTYSELIGYIATKILSAGYVKKDEIELDEERIFELIKNIVSNRGKAQAIREHKKEIIK